MERQCDFDVVDDDVLGDSSTRVENGRLAMGPMRYRTIVLGPTHWMSDAAQRQLKTFQSAGGQVVRAENLDQIDAALAAIAPTVKLDPPSPDLRVVVRRWKGGGAGLRVQRRAERLSWLCFAGPGGKVARGRTG